MEIKFDKQYKSNEEMNIVTKKVDRKVWIVNVGEQIDNINIKLKKHIFLKPNIPLQFDLNIAMDYVDSFKDVTFCDNPEAYFKDRKLKRLIVRDAGIGDLLMLEPILHKLATDTNTEIDVACMYPEVFENHPTINRVITMSGKEHIDKLRLNEYDCWEDLRNYSEVHHLRDKAHRTDIYNEPFNMELSQEEKEPKLYFKENEKSVLTKKKGYIYIGIQCDASHKYRRYDKGKELIEYILKINKKAIIVLLGHYDFVKGINNKRVIDLQGKTDRRQAICLIRDLDYLVAADSGLMHVALTCHVPTVAMFSIITPDLRLRYYSGEKRVIWKDLDCKGCGDFHMVKCKKIGKEDNSNYLAPCMDISPEEIYNKMFEMPINNNKRVFIGDRNITNNRIIDDVVTPVNINLLSKRKLTMPIIVQNEEHNLPRFIENVINHPSIGRVIAIDGGSTDNTVEILRKAGAEVYSHPYIKTYHEMQAMQRNISCSYLIDGENIIIMDIDECFSKELSEYLPVLADSNNIYGLVSRRTFDFYKDITDSKKQIKDYPDWQPRFYKWNRKFKFVGGAHHITLNCPEPIKIQKDIIHFEKEGKNRDLLEKQWSGMMNGVRAVATGL